MDKQELYQKHGDHIAAIMSTEEFLKEHLHIVLQESKVLRKIKTHATLDDMPDTVTDVASLSYGDEELALQATIAYNPKENVNEFVSMYPYVKDGSYSAIKMTIENVIEWDNQLEATIYASMEGFDVCFFATDYSIHKDLYKVGSALPILIAAIGLKVEVPEKGFSFEGQQAIDWLAKIGEKPEYDNNGNVKPVNISTENMVAYLPTDSKCPDEAEFQSPSLFEGEASLLGIDFIKTKIIIHREGYSQLAVPLYFRKEFVPNYCTGYPLRGWLWLTGRISEKAMEREKRIAEENKWSELGKMARRIADSIDDFEFYKTRELNDILPLFDAIHIKDGLILDAFKEGDEYGSCYVPYCHPSNEHGIEKMLSYKEGKAIEPALKHFSVPFTKEGIVQARFIDELSTFLPKGWHANYNYKTFIFTEDDLDALIDKKNIDDNTHNRLCEVDLKQIVPKVLIGRDAALLTYSYWSPWRGLVKIAVSVEKEGESVVFGETDRTYLVNYNCGLRF